MLGPPAPGWSTRQVGATHLLPWKGRLQAVVGPTFLSPWSYEPDIALNYTVIWRFTCYFRPDVLVLFSDISVFILVYQGY